MAALDLFERRHVAAMRVVKDKSAAQGRIKTASRVSRRDDSTVGVPPIAVGDLDGDAGSTIRNSQCLLLVEWLVQQFVVDTGFAPPTARRLLAPMDLPPALERVAMQAQRCLQTWFAWADGSRIWFLVAEMVAVPSPHCQGEAIRMNFYDEDGRLVSRGTWALQSERSWMLCER